MHTSDTMPYHLVLIKELLHKDIGLHAETVGDTAIANAVSKRMELCSLADIEDYLDYLRRTKDEHQRLIDQVIVPETWFFRDTQPFVALRNLARDHAKARGLRILSVPCSTGEEPYSIAITLLDAGLKAEQFQIDACDISEASIARAQAGVYGKNSFRGDQNAQLLQRFFQDTAKGRAIIDAAKAPVQFRRANIFDPNFQLGEQVYDVIFCRNLIIYFDAQDKQRAFNVLDRLLKPNGLLFIGHSEGGIIPSEGYSMVPIARAFAYVKSGPKNPATDKQPTVHVAPKPRRPARPSRPAPAGRRHAPQPPPAAAPVAEPAGTGSATTALKTAQSLADQGRLGEAAGICQDYLKTQGDDAHAYYLLGLIGAARSDIDDAQAQLRKAIYLDPKHYEALIHLSLILEEIGDAKAAQRLRERATRITREADHD